jgi:hypothetical protein
MQLVMTLQGRLLGVRLGGGGREGGRERGRGRWREREIECVCVYDTGRCEYAASDDTASPPTGGKRVGERKREYGGGKEIVCVYVVCVHVCVYVCGVGDDTASPPPGGSTP